jgi:exodeoxyribonuclease III
MTYNILDGAVGTLSKIIKIVNQENPDYLTLNEANTFANDNNKILNQFSKETGFANFDIALSGEYDYHVAVFSRYPFEDIKKIQPLARACLITTINSPFGLISVASSHLTPYAENLRLPEIDLILDSQREYENRILMGDMNSLSKHDMYDKGMINKFNDAQLKKFTTDGEFRFDAIDKIIAFGYYDSAMQLGKNRDFTVPTPSNVDVAHAKMRLDYIFLSKSLLPHLHTYRVVKNDLADEASDHYPVVIELK